MTAMLLYLVYGLGLGLSGAFLLLHRPRHWMRLEAVNSSGWIVLMAVLFARGLALLVIRGGPGPFQGWADAVISLGVGFAIDALLFLRLLSWFRFKNRRDQDGTLPRQSTEHLEVPRG